MTRSALLALALIALPAAARAQTYSAPPGAYPINPGYWEVTTDWLGLIKSTTRYCVEPRNISKFLAAPCNHIYHCNYPVQRITDGKAYFVGTITGHDELYHVHGGGTYSPTTMDMHVSGSGHWHIVPVAGASATLQARFLSPDCPPGAKHFNQH